MSSLRKFSQALEALTELRIADELPAPLSTPQSVTPSMSRVLAEIGPLPREALFLGVASDNLPVLLNLHDPVPGPVLVAGEAGSGKTAFLQTIAHSISFTHNPAQVQFAVIAKDPAEWEALQASRHRVGIFPSYHSSAQDLLLSLASWAHGNNRVEQSIVLVIDDLEAVAGMDVDALQNLRWLLLRGPSRRVWPIVAMSAERYGQVISWIPFFRTRIFGRITSERVSTALGGDQASALETLEAGIQFSLRENRNWVRFWIPSLDSTN